MSIWYVSQKKCEKLFWECFLWSWISKGKLTLMDSTLITYPKLEIPDVILLRSNLIELVAKDALSSLYAWHTFDNRKTFCQKTVCNLLVFLIVSTKSMEVLIELAEDCYCDLSVPISNGYTIHLSLMPWLCVYERTQHDIQGTVPDL